MSNTNTPSNVPDSASDAGLYSLRTAQTQIVIAAPLGAAPTILHWGAAMAHTDITALQTLATRQWAFGGEQVVMTPSLSNPLGNGHSGPSGFIADRSGLDWAGAFLVTKVDQSAPEQLTLICEDSNRGVRAGYCFVLDPETHVLEVSTEIFNLSKDPLTLQWCAAMCLPLSAQLTRARGFKGRWAAEFQTEDIPAFRGSYVRENKSGRTSHDTFPGLLVFEETASETAGEAVGVHLGWSGNSRLRLDRHYDGTAAIQMGELLFPGEIMLGETESYTTPVMYAARSNCGFNGVSQQFHQHVQTRVMDGRAAPRPRPVHYNTWEAVYFDHKEETLLDLAELAASVGAERFVLDDGWFGGRRNDGAGLGDWDVSSEVYPGGLTGLADKVRSLGMEFGIWFEPEMVNPDSDLFRAHPDWVLEVPGMDQVPFRNQYALDLTREDVRTYLFGKMSAVIRALGAAYIKWDMNRIIHHPGSGGRPAIHAQTQAVYTLMQQLRDVHPDLEIESCASGGGRADYGVLRYTDRIWTSDNNDALERQAIQRGASYFFPQSVLGNHVGPKQCHITGRVLSMAFRAGAAVFGHMGMEVDLREESAGDLSILKAAIALHKRHRDLIHSGLFFRMPAPPEFQAMVAVSHDRAEALVSASKLTSPAETAPGRLRFLGLRPEARYRVRQVWPQENISITRPSIVEAAGLLGAGQVFSGEALMRFGLQLPLIHPLNCLIFHAREEAG